MAKSTRVYTVKEAAEVLGVSPATIRRLIDRGKLPAIRVGRSVRIERCVLEQILTKKGA